MNHQFPMNIIVREVAKSDATGIAQNISLRPQSEIEYTTKLISQEIEALEANPNSKIFVACVNNEVVGFARALSSYRLQWLKNMGVEYFYSFTNSENLASLQMHKAFGFEEVMTNSGFLNVNYTTGTGVLFRIKIL
ncbi:N-acetyltransferase family protein [Bdellovibrio bacteriovorus]|uniref:GNAT family N-acetyltransferase n=1 Tax=Bdellovibrio TaxID=958 RepID=UPI0035A9A4A6